MSGVGSRVDEGGPADSVHPGSRELLGGPRVHLPSRRAEVPIGQILAEGNIRSFWKGDEHAKRLVDSIRSVGVIEPIVVVPIVPANGHRFRLIAGFRRYTAACEAGLDRIPAVVREGLSEAQILEIQLVENLQRLDMNPIEEARAVRDYLAKTGLDQVAAGRRLGRSGPWISLRVGLLSLPEEVQQLVSDGILSIAHANALIPLSDRPRSELVRLAELGRTMAIGPWKSRVTAALRGPAHWVPQRRIRDICTCTCSCCSNHEHSLWEGRKS